MAYTPLFDDNRTLRKRNRLTVEQYMSMKGLDRAYRWMLYDEDCGPGPDGFIGELMPPFEEDPEEAGLSGIEKRRRAELMNLNAFPDWGFYNNVFFETEDPDYIVVEGDGWGTSYLHEGRPFLHRDHYFHCFRLNAGHIKHYFEVRNVLGEQREFGIYRELPVIERFEAQFEATLRPDVFEAADGEDDPALRAKNLGTVKAYFGGRGKELADRYRLFTEDATSGPGYTADGRILRASGREKIRAAEAIRAEAFPDWEYSGLVVHQTADPRFFAADVVGGGTCAGYAERPFDYKEHFYYSFRLEDGKIISVREYYNPAKIPELMGF